MVVTSKKEDFLTSHVQNFECIIINTKSSSEGGSAASEISFLESMSSSGGGWGGFGENNIIGTILQKRTVF